MALAAKRRGLKYLAVTDHSQQLQDGGRPRRAPPAGADG
ncbi:MAG: hypothetical protein MZU95_10785 [Desulfomicrobium escambiense]|nr:hypothetical protein [Desulfomicrobium escambiense]